MPGPEEAALALCARAPASLLRKAAAALERCAPDEAPDWGALGTAPHVACDLVALLRQYPAPQALASVLRYGALTQERAGVRELVFVWTGPSRFPEARRTAQVLLDIIDHAERRLLLASFAAYKVDSLLAALRHAVARGVRVGFLLETPEDSAGQLTHGAEEAFRDLRDVTFYHWPKEQRPLNRAGRPGKMHAKCAVSEKSLFITSANLTADAIEHNMELGMLCHDARQAANLLRRFDELIARGVLRESG